MIFTIISLLSLVILFSALYRLEYSIAAYLIYLYCVPLITYYCFGFEVGLNWGVFLFLFLFILRKYKFDKQRYQLLRPFVFLYLGLLFLIPFSSDTPLLFQLDSWRFDFFSLLLPLIIINIYAKYNSSKKVISMGYYAAIFVNTIYLVTLLSSFGVNPYIDNYINHIRPAIDKDLSFLENEGIRIFGYISACFRHVTQFAAFLIPAIVLVFCDFLKDKNKWNISALVLLIISIAACGSRSVLYSFFVLVLSYLLLKRNYKVLAYAFLTSSFLIILFALYLPEFFDYVLSINSSSVAGSSTSMRLSQYQACLKEVMSFPLGHGYNWTNFYKINHGGAHPTMLGFEGLPIQILCNGGIPGLIVWSIFIFKYTTVVRRYFYKDLITLYCLYLLLIGYLTLTLFTGDYGGIHMFVLAYSIISGKYFDSYGKETHMLKPGQFH